MVRYNINVMVNEFIFRFFRIFQFWNDGSNVSLRDMILNWLPERQLEKHALCTAIRLNSDHSWNLIQLKIIYSFTEACRQSKC